MDIRCAQCREPWDAYGVRHGDMEPGEATQFLKGEGCPCCGFGKICPQCDGTGRDRGHGPVPECPVCHNRRAVTVRRHDQGCSDHGFRYGYVPHVQVVPDAVAETIRLTGWRRISGCDGTAYEGRIPCWACQPEDYPPCAHCDGTGHLRKGPDADDRAAGFRAVADLLEDDPDGQQAMLEDFS